MARLLDPVIENISKHTTGHLFHLLKTDLTELKKNSNYKVFFINLLFTKLMHGIAYLSMPLLKQG